jgi:DNA primase
MVSNQSAKEEIRRTADIVELIGQFVKLKKAGRNYVGLCPFHAEKEPSFTVSPERQTFHCFGCKKGGDIFSFWMEYHSATFPESLRDLAEKYHVTISEGFSRSKEREKAAQREALFKINEKATTYFQKALTHHKKGGAARDYFEKRFLSSEMISNFRLGYAPDEWDGLIGFFRRENVNLDNVARAGLIIPRKDGGYYDRFRDRIIFPIFDLRQQVVGFGGRVLDDSLPKYLNTPETPIFRKGEFLYGLNASHKSIREKGRAVIVEGYMDWLALKKHGIEEAVATLGTALTERHVRRLKGYADEAVIVFDSDEAGKTAAIKSLPIFSNEGLSVRAVVLPEGHDPDSFVNANGSSKFVDLLDQAPSMFDFFLKQKLVHKDSDVEIKVRLLKEILPVMSELQDSAQRSLYVRRLSEWIGIKEDVLWAQMRSLENKVSASAIDSDVKTRLAASQVEKRFDDLHLLNLLIHYPETASRLVDCEWRILLSDVAVMEIIDTFFQKYSQEGSFSPQDLLESLASDDARKQYSEALVEPPHYSNQEVDLAVAEIMGKAHQKMISESIKKARGNAEALNKILELKRSKEH